MYISAKADYALRARGTLVVEDRPLTADALARRQGIPANYRENILIDLRRASLRDVLERMTLADRAAGRFPAPVRRLLADEDAWRPH